MKKTFLEKLQEEAAFQAQLSHNPLLPKKLDILTSFVGAHAWQVILFSAVCTALFFEAAEKM